MIISIWCVKYVQYTYRDHYFSLVFYPTRYFRTETTSQKKNRISEHHLSIRIRFEMDPLYQWTQFEWMILDHRTIVRNIFKICLSVWTHPIWLWKFVMMSESDSHHISIPTTFNQQKTWIVLTKKFCEHDVISKFDQLYRKKIPLQHNMCLNSDVSQWRSVSFRWISLHSEYDEYDSAANDIISLIRSCRTVGIDLSVFCFCRINHLSANIVVT